MCFQLSAHGGFLSVTETACWPGQLPCCLWQIATYFQDRHTQDPAIQDAVQVVGRRCQRAYDAAVHVPYTCGLPGDESYAVLLPDKLHRTSPWPPQPAYVGSLAASGRASLAGLAGWGHKESWLLLSSAAGQGPTVSQRQRMRDTVHSYDTPVRSRRPSPLSQDPCPASFTPFSPQYRPLNPSPLQPQRRALTPSRSPLPSFLPTRMDAFPALAPALVPLLPLPCQQPTVLPSCRHPLPRAVLPNPSARRPALCGHAAILFRIGWGLPLTSRSSADGCRLINIRFSGRGNDS